MGYGRNAGEFERPLHRRDRKRRASTARPSPPPSAAIKPIECNGGSVRAHRPLGQMGRLAQAEALRLAVLLQLLRDLGLHLFRLDLTVARLGIFVVARQVVVFAFDLRDLQQPRVVRSLLGAEVVPERGELVELTFDTVDLRDQRDVCRIVGSLDRVRHRPLVGAPAPSLTAEAFSAAMARLVRWMSG